MGTNVYDHREWIKKASGVNVALAAASRGVQTTLVIFSVKTISVPSIISVCMS